MGKMRKTDVEDWKEIAEKINEVQAELHESSDLIYQCPKSVFSYNWHAVKRNFGKVKSKLESRFAKEHPEEFDTKIFYPGEE